MSFEPMRIRQLFISPAAEATFSTDPVASGATMILIPAVDPVFTPTQDFIARNVQRDSLTQHPGVIGGKGGQLSLKTEIMGLATAASGLGVVESFFSALLKACSLAETIGTGSTTTVAAHTTTEVTVTSAAGIAKGTLVSIGGEVRMVTAVAGAVLTLAPALSAAPSGAGGTAVYSSASYSTTDADPGSYTFTFKLGGSGGAQYTATGCKGKVKFSGWSARGMPMAEFTFECDSWTITAKGSLPSTLVDQTAGVIARGSPVWWGSTSTPTSEVGFDFGHTLTARASVLGADGRSGWAVTEKKPVASLKPYYTAQLRTDFLGTAGIPTERSFLAQIGSTAAAPHAAVYAHRAQIVAFPKEADVGGLVGHEVSLGITNSQDSGVPDVVFGSF